MLFGRSRPVPPEGVSVPLREKVNRARLRALLNLRARANDLPARDARLTFSGVTPVVTKPRIGVVIDVPKATGPGRVGDPRCATAPRYALPSTRVRPAVTSVGPAVIIERDSSGSPCGGPASATLTRSPSASRPTRRRPASTGSSSKQVEPHLVPARLALGGGPRPGAARA